MNKKSKEKVQKNVELVSVIASEIESMKEGDTIRLTPFAKSIILSSGSSPHVDTVRGKLTEAKLWMDLTPKIRFLKKGDNIVGIEKISDNEEMDIKKEIREDLKLIKNRIDSIEFEIKKKR